MPSSKSSFLYSSAASDVYKRQIMSRVQVLTHCQSVGITLRDADAPGRGRVYLLASGLNDLPVNRIALDDGMMETLAGETNGLTVVRCEDVRHSFLKPLADTGAVFFWVWPVTVSYTHLRAH